MHAPVQPENTNPELGPASARRCALANAWVQSPGQAMPVGFDVTEPLPVMFTVSVRSRAHARPGLRRRCLGLTGPGAVGVVAGHDLVGAGVRAV